MLTWELKGAVNSKNRIKVQELSLIGIMINFVIDG